MSDVFFAVVTPLTTCILNYVGMYMFFNAMSKQRLKKPLSPVAAGSFVMFLLCLYFVKEPFIKLAILCISTVMYTFLFSYKLYNRFFVSFAYIALCSMGENIIMYVSTALLDEKFYLPNNGIEFFTASVASKLVGFVIVYIVAVSKKQLLYGKFRPEWLSLLSMPLSTVLVSISMYYTLVSFKLSAKLSTVYFVSTVVLIASNFLVFKIVDNLRKDTEYRSRLEYAEQLVKQQEKQYRTLFNSSREVYKLEHDSKNFLLGILSQIQACDTEAAVKAIKEKTASMASHRNTLTGNSTVDTVLNFKLAEAAQKGIKVDFEHRNLVSLEIAAVDFSILVGNALDNAVEASEKLPENQRYIKLFIIVNNGRVNINVSNNVAESIDTARLQSYKNDGEKHGFGIINMQSIAARLGGEVLFRCESGVFTAMISVDNTAR